MANAQDRAGELRQLAGEAWRRFPRKDAAGADARRGYVLSQLRAIDADGLTLALVGEDATRKAVDAMLAHFEPKRGKLTSVDTGTEANSPAARSAAPGGC
jgi:hypothetical protein